MSQLKKGAAGSMRHIRSRRRFKLLLTLALALLTMLFAETRIEAFVPQVKNFAEFKIEESFGGKYKLSIGNLDGGILHPIVLNDVRITDKNGQTLASPIDIERIKTNFRIWDMLFKIKGGGSNVCINFSTKNKESRGVLRLTGDAKNAYIRGSIDTPWAGNIRLTGSIKENEFDAILDSPKGVIRLAGLLSEEGVLSVDIKVEHLKLGAYDIVCDVVSKITAVNNQPDPGGNYIMGEFETKNLILNYKPFPDFKVRYKIRDGSLDIEDAKIGEAFRLNGSALVRYPYTMDMVLAANNVSLTWLLQSLGMQDGSSVLSGTLNGKFGLKGPVAGLKLNAHMEIRKGTIATLDFESLSATIKGDLPFVRIEDSRVTRESGYFSIAGEMDLSKIGKSAIFDNLKLASDDKAITWDEWRSAGTQGSVQEVSMKKRISGDLSVDFKKFVAESKIDESMKDKDEVGLEYKLQPNDSLKMMVGQDSKFLGLEHKDKF